MFQIRPGKWTGLQGMGEELLRAQMSLAEDAVMRAVIFAASEVKLTLTGTRHGRTYRVSKTGRLHVAAAPGEPPAVLLDNLRGSVGHSKPVWEGKTVSAEFGVGLGAKPKGGKQDPSKTYARIQEFGGLAGRKDARVRIPAHPYLEPTAVRISPQLEQILEQPFA